jgi:probable phosphoglycerate mutase
MMRILLIRHGETPWNRSRRWQGHADVPLSREGLEQAIRLALHLKEERTPIDRIYSSDLRRAQQTAQKLVEALATELVVDPALREIEVGKWTGLSQDEIKERFAEEWARIAAGEDLPRGGGETFAAFSLRIVAALDRLRRRHGGKTVAAVTHGGVIRAALLHALGLPWLRIREVAAVDNTALTELLWDGTIWTVGRRNHTPHLASLAPEVTG